MSEQDRNEIATELARRISSADDIAPWMTVQKALVAMDNVLAASEGDDAIRLQAHRSFLVARGVEAARLLV